MAPNHWYLLETVDRMDHHRAKETPLPLILQILKKKKESKKLSNV